MDPFPIILIVIFIIILITIIGVVIFLIVNNSGSTPTTSECVNNDGCGSGFLCQTGVCKAGIGTTCTQDSNCGSGLRCDPGTQVCVPNTVAGTSNPSPIHPRKQDFSIITDATLPPPPQPDPIKSPLVIQTPIELPAIELPAPPPIKTHITPLYWTDPSQIELTASEPDLSLHQLTSRPSHSLLPISNTPLSPISSPSLIRNPTIRNPTTRTIVRPHRIGDSITPLSDAENNSELSPSMPVIYRRAQIESSPSSDDEINSVGQDTDQPFDIRSGASTPDSSNGSDGNLITQISTPCHQKDGIYYCRNQADQIEELQMDTMPNSIRSSPVIDICSYSNLTLFLLADGHIISEKDSNHRTRIINNIQLIQIRAFNGYIYGVDREGRLYFLPNNYLSSSNWRWNLAGWAPSPIQSISTTHDGVYLWIQTDFNRAYLYDRPYHCILELENYKYRRIYGRDLEHYLEIDSERATAILHPENKQILNICDGALSYYDEVVAIHPNDRDVYRGVAIINWRPYYIRY